MQHILISVEAEILPVGGSWNESGELLEKFTLSKGESKQIIGTNYSLVLVDVKGSDSSIAGAISVELHNDSGYEGQVLIRGTYDRDGKWEKENFKIVVDKIFKNHQVDFCVFLI